jgi:hypothetical protein
MAASGIAGFVRVGLRRGQRQAAGPLQGAAAPAPHDPAPIRRPALPSASAVIATIATVAAVTTTGPSSAPPPPFSGRSWSLDQAAFRVTRRKMTEEELAGIETHSELQDYKRDKAANWLASSLPQSLVDHMVAGSAGVEVACRQVPDPAQRRLGLVSTFLFKAGPDGSALGKARRALEELVLFAPEAALPASAILLNRLLAHVDAAARKRKRGSQGGATVAWAIRSGLVTLAALGFPLDVGHISVDAGAPPARKAMRQRRAGSLPIVFYLHFEMLAASLVDSFARFYARSLCIAWLFASLRMVDVLRAAATASGVDTDGALIIQILTSFSKDGAPLDVYLRAEGFSGPWPWAPEHLAALNGRPYVLPAFKAAARHAGDITHATSWASTPRPRVTSSAHALTSMLALAALPPLSFTKEQMAKMGLKGHSGHGSPSDIAASVGPHAAPAFAFFAVDEQELGLWRRRAASSADGELTLDPGLQAAVARAALPAAATGQQRPMPHAAPAALSAEDASMRVRYTQGENRQGRRTSQIRVRRRLCAAVREAIRLFGQPFPQLRALATERATDYSILAALTPEPAAAPPAAE